ncbi:MAG: FecR family protein [Candidatus Limnocylindria bacterium]
MAALLLAASGALVLVLSTVPAPASASSTTITVLAGTATVTGAGGPATAASGDLVRAGDEVRTSADGHAVLTFFDGSTIVVEPGTTLVLEEATAGQGSIAVRVFQSVGTTWSSVAGLLSAQSRFEVRTPAATASVRGTAFEVEVAADGATRVRTSDGAVAVSNAAGEVLVGEGAETTARPDEAPAPPSAPPPSTRRVLEIGERAVLVVDAVGRGCGLQDGKVVQEIPGCVVREGRVEIEDTEDVGDYRLAVTEDVGSDTTVVERTFSAGGAETVRTLDLPATAAAPRTPVPGARPTIEVTLPLIGTIPVQLEVATAVPVARTPAAASPTGATLAAPTLTLPPLPFGRATATPLPTTQPAPVLTATPTVAPPIVPTPTPILAVPTLNVELTPTPTPTPSPSPTPSPTPTPAPTTTPTPTDCTIDPLPVGCP